jgi:hypothetical protein
MAKGTPYDLICEFLKDNESLMSYIKSDDFTPVDWGLADHKQRDEFNSCLNLIIAGMQMNSMQSEAIAEQHKANLNILSLSNDMVFGIKSTLKQIDAAYRVTSRMYQVSFMLGIALIIMAIITGFIGKDSLLTSIFGALGLLDVLVFFLLKPQEKLQASRSSLAQVQAALYNWYIESMNIRGSIQHPTELRDRFFEASKVNMANTEKTLDMLQRYTKLED